MDAIEPRRCGVACDRCRPFFAAGPEAGELREVFETLSEWTDHPESGLYVQCAYLRCKSCDQRAYMDDNAWDGPTFEER